MIWHEVEKPLRDAVDRSDGLNTMELIYKKLMDTSQQLWIGRGGVAVTEINTYPDGRKWLNFVIVSGEGFEFYRHFQDEIEAGARDMGCVGSELYLQ